MAEFQSRSLSLLDRIYDFVGGTRGLSRFSLEGDIQPVHDLSREAELGARNLSIALGGGYLALGMTLTHAGADTQFGVMDPYAALASIPNFSDFDPVGQRKDRLWLVSMFATQTVDTAVSAGVEMEYLPTERNRLLARWNDSATSLRSGGANRPLVTATGNLGGVNPPVVFPIQVPTLTLFNFRNVSGAAVTVRFHLIWWAGPLGAPPPGMS